MASSIELSTSVIPAPPTAISITSSASPKTQSMIGQMIVRQNQIRHTNGDSGPHGTVGITLECIEAAIVEENLLSIGDSPDTPNVQKAIVRTATVKKMKTFNNQSNTGLFLPCWNGSSRDGDPITDMEDSLLAL